MGAQRHGGGGHGLESGHDGRRLGARVAHQLEVVAAGRTRHQPDVIRGNLAAAQTAQRALRGGNVNGIPRRITHQGEQSPLRIEEAHGVAHDLLDDAVQLERVG